MRRLETLTIIAVALVVGCGKAKDSATPAGDSAEKPSAENSPVAGNTESSDTALRQKLLGTWRSWATPTNGGLVLMDTTYNPDGSWSWTSDTGASTRPRRTMSESGLWRVKDGYLYVRGTNSVGTATKIDPNEEVRHEFLSLTAVECTTRGSDSKTRKLFRKEAAAAGVPIPSDATLRSKLVGTWRDATTNQRGGWLVGDATYKADGTATWAVDFGTNSSDKRKYQAQGIWRVDRGYYCDLTTNATGRKFDPTRWSCSEVLSVTETEITYRDQAGRVSTDTRQ